MLSRIIYYGQTCRKYERLRPEDLRRVQEKRLKAIVRHAYSQTRFWHDWLKSAGVTPDDIQCLEALLKIPACSKQDLLERPLEERIVGDMKNLVRRRSSGTTGNPADVYYSRAYSDYHTALRFRTARLMGFGQFAKIARIRFDVPRDLTSAPEGYRAPTKKRGRRWSPVEGLRRGAKERFERTVSFGESAREMIPDLLHFKPDVIWSNPSHARQLADVIAEDGIKGIRPKFVVLGGEILDEPTRAYLESTFGANAYPIYGAVELGSIARSCTERAGMHLMADSLLVEVLRDGEPVSPGEPGEMVVTNLLNEAMPLIRYKIGDVVIASGEPCQCGVTLPMLKSVEGRSVDYILLSNGESLSPRRILTFLHSVNDLPRTRRHQFLQRSLDRFELQIIGEEEPEARVQADGVAARLRPLLGKNATIEVSFEDIRRRTVKFRPVVSLPSRQRLGKGVTLDKASSD